MVELTIFLSLLISVAFAASPCEKPTKDCNNKTSFVNEVKAQTLCSWEKLLWNDDSVANVCSENQVASKNIPWKFVVINSHVYVLIRSKNPGTYSSLNRFLITDAVANTKNTDGSSQCPALDCYPSCEENQFFASDTCEAKLPEIIDAVDVFRDKCGRLWVFDTGCYHNGTQFQCVRASSLTAFSSDDVLLERISVEEYEYSETYSAMIVNDDELDCESGEEKIYFYLLDSKRKHIRTYSLNERKFWEFRAVPFRPEPSESNFEVQISQNQHFTYTVNTGVKNAVRGPYGLFFHCGAGKYLYHIPYAVLNNEEASKQNELTFQIEKLTKFNKNGQSVGLLNDGNIFYFLQIQNGAVACVNGAELKDFQLITVDKKKFSSTCSIQLYADNTGKKIMVFSNNRFDIHQNGLNETQPNFVISYIDPKDVETFYPECKGHFMDVYRPPGAPADYLAVDKFQQAAAEKNECPHGKDKKEKVELSRSDEALYQMLLAQILGQQKKLSPDCMQKQKPVVYGL
ncbi:L-dopachrome tautomerase yellow-f-like [Culicoides brevitarsis]|uniref:L-dopachrome tautomerase yellow-f-like n=1 Tax=Culicoides brevitarsis TaxID=469753 RepID=UPI00307B9FC6